MLPCPGHAQEKGGIPDSWGLLSTLCLGIMCKASLLILKCYATACCYKGLYEMEVTDDEWDYSLVDCCTTRDRETEERSQDGQVTVV